MGELLLSIERIAKESGLASSALRYYERCGLISEGIKIGGRRHYSPAVLQRLSVIKVCQTVGFSLAEIAELLNGTDGEDGSWRELAKIRKHEIEQQIRLLHEVAAMLDTALECSCSRLSDCPEMGPDGHLANHEVTKADATAVKWPSRPQTNSVATRTG